MMESVDPVHGAFLGPIRTSPDPCLHSTGLAPNSSGHTLYQGSLTSKGALLPTLPPVPPTGPITSPHKKRFNTHRP